MAARQTQTGDAASVPSESRNWRDTLRQHALSLVGERMAGALLAGRADVLPDDSLLEVAVSDAVIGDELRLEGVGIAPDVQMAFPLAYAAGKDP